MRIKLSLPLAVLFFLLAANQSYCQVRLPKLISDGMVLQRNTAVTIWGWAAVNEKVTVNFNTKKYTAVTDSKGKWQVRLITMKAGGPYNMTIDATNHLTIKNILIGDVWLCSGQSNMELMMERVKYKYADEIAKAGNPFIRQFTIPDKYNFIAPEEDVEKGSWVAVNPKGILEFSAVAYFFAKDIYAKYKIPIGLINASLGGSPAEAWISEDALKHFPSYYQEVKRFKNNDLINQIEKRENTVIDNWYDQLNKKDEGELYNWRAGGGADSGWREMNVPGYWADNNNTAFNGAVWFRKEFTATAAMSNKPVKLELGRIVDADSVFINGRFAGATSYQYPPRRYELPTGFLKEGSNIIVVRVVSNSGRGGFVKDKKYELTTAADTIKLDGAWKYRTGAVMQQPTPDRTFIRWKPLGLYNAMIAPLIYYPIKGVIWYQGEANTKNPGEYKKLMQALITDWRVKWRESALPFLFVQLANFMETKKMPVESSWAATRDAQRNTLTVPNTGMAVAIDLGEWNDIHPENKMEVGRRLALQAKAIAYHEKNIVASGPLYSSMKVDGNKIVISFTNIGSGLTINGNQLNEFAIAGADKKFVWANAKIEGDKVIVWNDAVSAPVAVRYAWADNPQTANLYNKEGLPASPFTTEHE